MYCSLEDLKKAIREYQLIELSNDVAPELPEEVEEESAEGEGEPAEEPEEESEEETINENNINPQILKADEIIDGYLRGRYLTPFSPVPGIIRDISVDIASYFLYTRRPDSGVPEEIKYKYEERIKFLKDIQKGTFLLDAPELTTGNSDFSGSGEYRTNKSSSDRIFTKDLLNRF